MKLLLATDGSAFSLAALQTALGWFPANSLHVTVVAVEASNTYMDAFAYEAVAVDPVLYQAIADKKESLAKRSLAEARALLEGAGVSATFVLCEGNPGEEILRVANDLAPDLVVLGSHGRGAIGRALLGSVAESVLHRWQGATLIVHRAPLQPGTTDIVTTLPHG
jgi:nucleotide-binding universal stress UspA family protein